MYIYIQNEKIYQITTCLHQRNDRRLTVEAAAAYMHLKYIELHTVSDCVYA